MNGMSSNGPLDLNLKIKEAETCYSMGMIAEALSVYQQVLPVIPDTDPVRHDSIQAKIDRLKKEIEDQEQADGEGVSAEDISLLKKTLSTQEDLPSLLDGAAALKELGLLDEAIVEYEKILQFDFAKSDCPKYDCSPGRVIKDYLSCLLETIPLREISDRAYRVIYRQNVSEKETAALKSWLGRELERRDHADQALELYQAALEVDPEHTDVKERLEALNNKLASNSRYDYLLRNEIVTTHQLQEALAIAKKINKSVEYVLIDRFKVKAEEVGKSLSRFYGCPFRSFDPELPVPFELTNKLKKSFLLYYVWVPLSWDKNGVEILVDDPNDLRKTDHIRALMNHQKINFAVGIKEDIESYIQYFFDPRAEKMADHSLDSLDEIIPDVSFEEEEDLEDDMPVMDESSSQVVKFVDQVLVTAFRNNASDVHIEPSPVTRKTTIRFRTDGVCQEYLQVPNAMAPAIISRLKIMAELDIAEKRLPQDGKIKLRRKGIQEFELRLSTMPTAGRFEDAVLRVLTRTNTLKLDEIGLSGHNLGLLKKLIKRPYGLILCVGPTGSGKTTTLHAALAEINNPAVKIWTAEDPVEITQEGLRQVQVRPKIGLDFSRVMRGFLRLDPDIIMIGEMRDRETAAIAIEAALTGHLVLSTLHTNNAPETLTRLLDMGMNPLNIADSFLGVLAQRLVRRLCRHCRNEYQLSEDEFTDLRMDYGAESFEATGYAFNDGIKLHRSDGCEKCSGSGYRGRLGIHELLEATPEVKVLIKKNATSQEIGRQAKQDGMKTLKQDGIHKVFDGVTDIGEVRRVCVE
jgi:type II secretory ATPase GspE/PulE/Tfp pilus assembly ATPase PilB-like protein